MIIDTNRRTTSKLTCLHGEGIRTIIRYYARSTAQPEKRLTRPEAEAILASGKSIAVVHQAGGANPGSFSSAKGKADAEYAFGYAIQEIGQPEGTAIYFAVDFDCNQQQFEERIVPHFQAIHDVNDSGSFSRRYEINAYGNGLVLSGLLDRGLIAKAWLSQSVGHHGSKDFKKTGRWTLFQRLPSTLCGLGVDVDDLHPDVPDFGQFSEIDDVESPGFGSALPGVKYKVVAASGLRLRSGPGIEFEIVRLLPPGTLVQVMSRHGDWSIVDLDGNGLADGAVHSAFLALANHGGEA